MINIYAKRVCGPNTRRKGHKELSNMINAGPHTLGPPVKVRPGIGHKKAGLGGGTAQDGGTGAKAERAWLVFGMQLASLNITGG
jgi:hypothetical protein